MTKVAHLNAPEVILAVIRAAADRNAETPGVIPTGGPHWSEGAFQPAWEPDRTPKHLRCSVCSHVRHDGKCPKCAPNDDHDYVPSADRKLDPDAIASVTAELRGHLAPTSPPAERRKHTPAPDGPAARARQALADDSTDTQEEPDV